MTLPRLGRLLFGAWCALGGHRPTVVITVAYQPRTGTYTRVRRCACGRVTEHQAIHLGAERER